MPSTHTEMASSRKKQEDKNLKILRELVTQSHNKKCFDCGQRGPTYVNMTIGAFVCTSCSGLLRGLNPPHRIKSISMASFNQQELDFLQKHGNQVCHYTWLGLRNTPIENESREEQKMKDHLVHKYERKVWYSDQKPPAVVDQPEEQPPPAKPLKTLLGNNVNVFVSAESTLQKPQAIVSATPSPINSSLFEVPKPRSNNNSMDLLSNFGNDPFASTAAPPAMNNHPVDPFQQSSQPGGQPTPPLFDAFTSSDDSTNRDSFDLFVNAKPTPPLAANTNQPSATPPVPIANGNVDKYAALAELDMTNTQSVFSSSSVFGSPAATSAAPKPQPTAQPNPFMSPSVSSSGAAVFQQQQQKPVNPFQSSLPTAAVSNTNIFASHVPPAAEVPQQQQQQNNMFSNSWDMPNSSMNFNSASNSTLPMMNAMTAQQSNSNFAFSGPPPSNNEFMNPMTGQPNIASQQQQNQSNAFSNQQQHNQNNVFSNQQQHQNQNNVFSNPQQHNQNNVFSNPQQQNQNNAFSNQSSFGFPNQAGFGNNYQFNTQLQKPQPVQQQPVPAAVPRQQTLFQQQFPPQQAQQYNFAVDSSQTSQMPAQQPMFNANFQQFPPNVAQNQSPFGTPGSTPFNQPVKSTNPFM